MRRFRYLITGLVQGVGFRPQVYRIAKALKLTGWVKNNVSGVLIEIQGNAVDLFLSELMANLPSLARIDALQSSEIPILRQEKEFEIIQTEGGIANTIIAPDTAICRDCLMELFDRQSRYHSYPFLNCTQCGPRITITRQLPYDRNQTTMSLFLLCQDCHQDYSTPGNRRYHAQPTACMQCGPKLSTSIEDISKTLKTGQIVALKGLGGYQLLCDASNEEAVLRLRKRKNREAKPLAVMLLNAVTASHYAFIEEQAQEELESPARPIVLLEKKNNNLAKAIAPGLSHLGIMLPSTPLHYLLFHALLGHPDNLQWLEQFHPFALVATSANASGNPLIINDDEAEFELSSIADLIVSYNRQIVTRMDDSVIRMIDGKAAFIRRARGYTPQRIKLAHEIPSTLALGGHLKNTFCITRGDEAFVSQHIGSLSNRKTIEFLHESLDYWTKFLNVTIECMACDWHPDFYSSHLANDLNRPLFPVQHHHAHLASVIAEQQILEPVLGLALDGYGYGENGEAWGGELLLLQDGVFQRLGHLKALPMPGGDMAAHEPWRMAVAVLSLLGETEEIEKRFSAQSQSMRVIELLRSDSYPHSSSCGRLFDAASALLGICAVSQFEGQAAMQLESLVTKPETIEGGWLIEEGVLSLLPMFKELINVDAASGANQFHGTLISALMDWLLDAVRVTGIRKIVLGGGCFLNRVLSEGLLNNLRQHHIQVYCPRHLPANDGGLSLGQAWIAAHLL
ncbi:carbamoyltransferase HypF [Legionella jordanis]|uniref:carbamoyltransferase HypF n=1 Tax=Legionella jordanis TaxID=456 RepID=UPI000EFE33A8|nr:carbamoyltransferase HypF [Legionella jordanis]RMX15132.1 carbamoyltransferase HypF [Legionella jordanis]